jgi:Zn-dependent M28 family amino/carboxypeptidase
MIRMPGESFEGPLPALDPREVALRDALRTDLSELVGRFGERNVANPASLEAAAAWVEGELRAAGHRTARQTQLVDGVNCENIEAERTGTSDEIVLVGAHYDSARGTSGANDNGSGVVALLALSRALAGGSSRRTVRFVAFANEEPPYFRTPQMGSAIYAARSAARGERIVAMLSLETMGYFTDAPASQQYPFPMSLFYPDRGDFIAFIGDVGSRNLVRAAVSTFRATTRFPSEGAALPAKTTGVGWSDHASFWDYGYPAIMVTDTALFRYRQYHSPNDTLDRVDVDRLARVTEGLRRVVEALAE